MSRPIDADALTHILESCRDTAPELRLQSIIAIDDAIQLVIDAPTIDVIPVKWLEAHAREYYEDWGEEPITVEKALKMWQRKKEG